MDVVREHGGLKELAAGPHTNGVAPAFVERFVKQLNITFKAVKLYPLSSNIPRDNARVALEVLHDILKRFPEVRLEVAKDGLFFESLPVYPGQPAFMAFAREFYNRGLAEVRFHAGTTIEELLRFLSLLDVLPTEITQSGGFEARLWELGVNSISVKEVSTRIVETDDAEEEPAEDWPPSSKLIDDILAEAFGRRPRAERLLTRLVADREALSRYLQAPGPGDVTSPAVVTHRLSALARIGRGEDPGRTNALHERLADAVGTLDTSILREVLARVLAEARHDESLASIVRAMELDDVAANLIGGASFDVHEREEFVRTVRNLVSLGLAPRQATLDAVGSALAEAGADETFTSAVLDDITPSRLRIRERPASNERPVDVVLQLLDVAANNIARGAGGELDTAELAREAAGGISDGDIFGALVTIVTLEDRPAPFASIMAMLEDNLGLLIERHDFDVAADAAEALVQAEQRAGLSDDQRKRLRHAVAQLAEPGHMRIITSAMRLHRSDSREHEACRRLLTVLGENTVSPLLEVLAEEKDMSNRKALVDMVSAIADRFIPELGERVGDSRWYFVRNVVGILGGTHDPKVLPYLARTLRHPDARVRRETLRAITGVKDALAGEMLIAALSDEDAGIVQLSARYLGSHRLRGAVPALTEVARGDGRGNRDAETRIDAIEALGRIGGPDAVPALEQIAKQRTIRAGRTRELRSAAESALAAIRQAGGGVA